MDKNLNNWRLLRISSQNEQGKRFIDNYIITSRYTIFSFFPKVLFEQFRKVSYFFFLALIILQLSLDVPTNPSAYITSFFVVIFVSLTKQGYEDWRRHKADKLANSRKIRVLSDSSKYSEIEACDLKVGQIVKLSENDSVPFDMLFLAAFQKTNHQNVHKSLATCQITTANLDGEPDLKTRFRAKGLPNIDNLSDVSFDIFSNDQIVIEYEGPSGDLYNFKGILTSGSTDGPTQLSSDNILLRGTTVKNCEAVFGIGIYTGNDTRLSLNSLQLKRNKFSVVEKSSNKLVMWMFLLLSILCGVSLGFFFIMKSSTSFSNAWYLPEDDSSEAWLGVTTFFLFLIFLSYMIPISLSVTIELQKFGSSMFFTWDDELKDPKTQNGPICNTSDLNDELGQIEYLLTDKTGTLTQNSLKLKCYSVNGIVYDFENLATDANCEKNEDEMDKKLKFLLSLALCHSVKVVKEEPKIEYQSSSGDEKTFVESAAQLGVIFMGENELNGNGTEIKIKINKALLSAQNNSQLENQFEILYFKKLHTFEFDSERKCMSVILEDLSNSRIFMLTKGAESVIFSKSLNLDSKSELYIDHINEFAKQGLRTLVFAEKELTSEEVGEISSELQKFQKNPNELSTFYSSLEKDLNIIGATGVEDELQEGVEKTLASLKLAGIKIWMLTGDKLETAINIGLSSGVLSKDNISTATKIIGIKDTDELKNEVLYSINNKESNENALLIDGESFSTGFVNFPDIFTKYLFQFSELIFCRMAPLQKAQVVKLLKKSSKNMKGRICAVGDGGNDVAMIQEAHVGIGLIGKEGRQAAISADFALPGFKFLEKTILVHGFWFYHRLAKLVSYFFYRGLVFVIPQFLYGFESGFSGQTVYHASFMMCYALIFSSVPILVYGLSEQPISKKTLISSPKLYSSRISGNNLMGFNSLLWWSFVLIWDTFLIFYFPMFIWRREFESMDWGSYSHFLNAAVLAVTNIKVATNTVYFTLITLVAQIFSFTSMLVFYTISSELLQSNTGGLLRFSYFPLITKYDFWLVMMLITALSIMPDLLSATIRRLHQ